MENQRWEESGRRSQEVRRSEKRQSGKQEDAGARKGKKVAIHCVFPMIWENTPYSDHFWKLRCRKSARRCGAKHISKSKCTKHVGLGPLLEGQLSKKCTLLWLWREGEQTKKKDNSSSQVGQKRWAYAGSEGAWSPEIPKTSTKMLGRGWLGRRLRRTWLAMKRPDESGVCEQEITTICKIDGA